MEDASPPKFHAFPLGAYLIPGDAAGLLAVSPQSLAGLQLLYCCSQHLQQGRKVGLPGMWHSAQLSQGRIVHLPACKEREKKQIHRLHTVYTAEPFHGLRQQLPTTTALSIREHRPKRDTSKLGSRGQVGYSSALALPQPQAMHMFVLAYPS